MDGLVQLESCIHAKGRFVALITQPQGRKEGLNCK
jgi:hypothetical protein